MGECIANHSFTDCAVNHPIDPSRFTYAGLGMRDGDLVMDRIEGVAYILRDGELCKLADFDTEPEPRRGNRLLRWILGGIPAILLLAFGARRILRRARTKKRSAAPP